MSTNKKAVIQTIRFLKGISLVVDPIGSGDAFSAGFMYKILHKENLHEACTYGNILGALAAKKPGATYPISSAHIEEFKSTEYMKSYKPEFSGIEKI